MKDDYMSDHNCLDNIMSVSEAADEWELSTAKVKQLCMYGQIKAKKLGAGTWVIIKDQPNPNTKK